MFISLPLQKNEEKALACSPFSRAIIDDSDGSCDSEPPLCIANIGTPERSSSGFNLNSIADQPSQINEKFWISKDLFITKEIQVVDESKINKPEITSEVTLKKINYNCKTLQEHSSRCQCSTPRLHIYLLFGHQCKKSCSMPLNASAFSSIDYSSTPEEANTKYKIEDHPCEEDDELLSELSIDTEYVVVSDESIRFASLVNNQPEPLKSTDDETPKIKKQVRRYRRRKSSKWTKKKKKTSEPVLPNCETFTNIISTSDKLLEEFKEEPGYSEDVSGIPADDFQKELLKITETTEKSTMIPKGITVLSDCWRDFRSLVKDEPINDVENHEYSELSAGFKNYIDQNTPSDSQDKVLSKRDQASRDYGVANIISPMKMKISFNFTKRNLPLVTKDDLNEVDSYDDLECATSEEMDLENVNIKPEPVEPDDQEEEAVNEDDFFRPKIEETYSEGPTSSNVIQDELILPTNSVKLETQEHQRFNSRNQGESEVKTLECVKCAVNFESGAKLKEHLEEHVSNGVFICLYCQKPFKDRTNMKRHMRVHTGEKPYKCKVCDKNFSLPGNFKKHRDTHTSNRTDPCEVCGKTFKRREHLVKHHRIHTGEKPYKCTLCPSAFTALYSLQIHMNNHLGKKPYECTFCNKCFSDRSTMRKHVRVHTGERPYKCSICSKTFSESGTLNGHMTTHNDNRPFSCEECKLSFKTASSLRQHYKIHFGVRSYSCKYCGNKFMQKYNLTTHERIHTGEKPFTCFHCERTFRSKSCLQKHIQQIHTGEQQRRFPCTECNKRFYRPAHLRRHLDSHLGIKDFECNICHKKFTSSVSVRSHTDNFHSVGARKFPCDKCGRIFKRQIYVNTHKCTNVFIEEVSEKDDTPSPQLVIKEEENVEELTE